MRNYLDSHFILTADLDLDVAPFNEGAGWQPIGTYVYDYHPENSPFTGSLDGNSHTIGGLFIDRPTQDNTGLIGYGQGASFTDLTLQVSISGNSSVGGLVGRLESGTVSGVDVSGTVQGRYTEVGGLVGYTRETAIDHSSAAVAVTAGTAHVGGLVGNVQNGSSIVNCHATGVVSSPSVAIGGLTGTFWGSTMENSYAIGNVSGKDSVGGLVGTHGSSSITRCYATGNVTATSDGTVNFGGLAGKAENGATITDAFATGAVHGVNWVGGLVGYSQTTGAITNTYATGHVTGQTDIGGLIGRNLGTPIVYSYYNSETSGQSDDTGKGEPRTTAQMRQGMAYNPAETYVGWFAGTPAWAIGENFNGGYPYLQALPRFTVAAAITGSGSIQWIGEYPHGATAELRLVPATDFGIKSAEGCGGTLAAPLFTTAPLTANCTVTGQFIEEFPWILFLPKKPADKK